MEINIKKTQTNHGIIRKNHPNMTKIVLKFLDIVREFWVNKTLRSNE